MISKTLWLLQSGLQALRVHTKLLFIGVLLFVLPILLLHSEEKLNQNAYSAIQIAEKETVGSIHEGIKSAFHHSADDAWLLLEKQTAETNSLSIAAIFIEVNGAYERLYTTAVEAKDPAVFVLQSAQTSDVFIFESYVPHRVWTAVSRVVTNEQTYVVVTEHSYESVDALFKEQHKDSYLLICLTFLFLLAVAYWLIKQINWQHKFTVLKGQLNEQDLLVTTITHEFRAPLTAILGHTSFLNESNRLRPKDKDSVGVIELSTKRLVRLVNDFLEVSQIQSGKLPLTYTQVSVSEVVHTTIESLKTTATAKGLYLRDATRKPTIMLLTDSQRLEQILVNIINNAIKYTNHGGVTITYEKTPLHVNIRVQDTGTGISAQDQQKLFGLFSRVGGVEKSNVVGSGLGMWITKRLVEKLGGSIGVESISGVGTHMVIAFDLRKIAKIVREEV